MDDTALLWGHPCVPANPEPAIPLPRLSQLTPPALTTDSPDLTPMRVLEGNVGGLEAQLSLLRLWLVSLSPDIVTLQEVWNMQLVDRLFQGHMLYKEGSVEGQGRGLLIGWRRSL